MCRLTPVQNRSHSPPRTVAKPRRSRIRDAGMGRLVQSPSLAGTDRQRAAGGVGTEVRSSAKRVGHCGLTQTKKSPGFPGRFKVQKCHLCVRNEMSPMSPKGQKLLVFESPFIRWRRVLAQELIFALKTAMSSGHWAGLGSALGRLSRPAKCYRLNRRSMGSIPRSALHPPLRGSTSSF
jgi:hypothetical protein